MLANLLFKSNISFDRHTIDIISDAAVMMNLDSRGMPSPEPPKPITIFLRARSFISIALGHTTLLISMSSSLPINICVSSIAASRLCAAWIA